MDDERRRADDKRLDRLEIVLQEVYAKINNGLTERTIRTEKGIDDLRCLIEEHVNSDHKEHAQFMAVVSNLDKNKQDKLSPMAWITIWSFIIMCVVGAVGAFSITTTKLDVLSETVRDRTRDSYYGYQAESEHKRLDDKVQSLEKKLEDLQKK